MFAFAYGRALLGLSLLGVGLAVVLVVVVLVVVLVVVVVVVLVVLVVVLLLLLLLLLGGAAVVEAATAAARPTPAGSGASDFRLAARSSGRDRSSGWPSMIKSDRSSRKETMFESIPSE